MHNVLYIYYMYIKFPIPPHISPLTPERLAEVVKVERDGSNTRPSPFCSRTTSVGNGTKQIKCFRDCCTKHQLNQLKSPLKDGQDSLQFNGASIFKMEFILVEPVAAIQVYKSPHPLCSWFGMPPFISTAMYLNHGILLRHNPSTSFYIIREYLRLLLNVAQCFRVSYFVCLIPRRVR